MLDGLRESGLVEGRDYVKTVRDAQGDMATVSGLVDAAVAEGADMLITFSTPTLQAAVQRAKQHPGDLQLRLRSDRGRRRHERHEPRCRT